MRLEEGETWKGRLEVDRREWAFMIGLAVLAAVLWLFGYRFSPAAALSTAETAVKTDEADAVALTVTVGGQPLTLTVADLQAIGRRQVKAEIKGERFTFEGASLVTLLTQLNLSDGATTLTMIGSDGYQAQASLADIRPCADCLIAWEGKSMRAVLPGMATRLWVRDLIKMEVH